MVCRVSVVQIIRLPRGNMSQITQIRTFVCLQISTSCPGDRWYVRSVETSKSYCRSIEVSKCRTIKKIDTLQKYQVPSEMEPKIKKRKKSEIEPRKNKRRAIKSGIRLSRNRIDKSNRKNRVDKTESNKTEPTESNEQPDRKTSKRKNKIEEKYQNRIDKIGTRKKQAQLYGIDLNDWPWGLRHRRGSTSPSLARASRAGNLPRRPKGRTLPPAPTLRPWQPPATRHTFCTWAPESKTENETRWINLVSISCSYTFYRPFLYSPARLAVQCAAFWDVEHGNLKNEKRSKVKTENEAGVLNVEGSRTFWSGVECWYIHRRHVCWGDTYSVKSAWLRSNSVSADKQKKITDTSSYNLTQLRQAGVTSHINAS